MYERLISSNSRLEIEFLGALLQTARGMRALNDGEIGPVEEPIRDFLSPAHLARLLETWFRDHAAELVPELADELSKEAGAGRCHGDMFLAMRAALTTVAHKQQETVRGNGFDDVNV